MGKATGVWGDPAATRLCENCQQLVPLRGYGSHRVSCIVNLVQLAAFFEGRTRLDGETGCVVVALKMNGQPYDEPWRLKLAGKRVYRLAYELYTGVELNPDVLVCHSCDNGACINWWHLWAGSHEDNMADMTSKRRSPNYKGPVTDNCAACGVMATVSRRNYRRRGRVTCSTACARSLQGRKRDDNFYERAAVQN